jgi:Uma2 family endonuclease
VYAEAGIQEYWIVNLIDGMLEVFRRPAETTYQDARRSGPDELISPMAAPASVVRVSDLLP